MSASGRYIDLQQNFAARISNKLYENASRQCGTWDDEAGDGQGLSTRIANLNRRKLMSDGDSSLNFVGACLTARCERRGKRSSPRRRHMWR